MTKIYDPMIRELALYVRQRLQVIDELSSIQFSIDVSGRVHDGDLNVKFEIGSTYSDGGVVKGAKLDVVIDEYLRRHGWDVRNQPLCITYVGGEKETEVV